MPLIKSIKLSTIPDGHQKFPKQKFDSFVIVKNIYCVLRKIIFPRTQKHNELICN